MTHEWFNKYNHEEAYLIIENKNKGYVERKELKAKQYMLKSIDKNSVLLTYNDDEKLLIDGIVEYKTEQTGTFVMSHFSTSDNNYTFLLRPHF